MIFPETHAPQRSLKLMPVPSLPNYLPLLSALAVISLSDLPAQSPEALQKRLNTATESQLQAALQRFPAADTNGDGTLSRAEAAAYLKKAFQRKPNPDASKGTPPTLRDIAYGPHERNVLDFWQATGDGPRPLVVFIHGGGFVGGDKSRLHGDKNLENLLKSGCACATINYRFQEDAPIQDILHDAARAVQFLRSKADEWNLDKTRFAAWGASAGAGTSLWLGSRDDLADPQSSDPVLRESSRVQVAVLNAVQATYNTPRWLEFLGPGDPSWWRSENEAAEFYHFKTLDDLKSPDAAPVLRECDMLAWINSGDAPVFINNPMPDTEPSSRGHYLHHPAHAREIEKHCQSAGVVCHWQQAETPPPVTNPVAFVLETLQVRADATGQ